MTAEKQGLTDAQVEEAARERMVYFIREKSKEGQFALRKDLLRDLRDHHLLREQEPEGQEPTDPVEALLKKTMELTGDLKELPGKEGVEFAQQEVIDADAKDEQDAIKELREIGGMTRHRRG